MISGNIIDHIRAVFEEALGKNMTTEEFAWDVWLTIDHRGFIVNFVVGVASPIIGQQIALNAFVENPLGITDDAISNLAKDMASNILAARSEQLSQFGGGQTQHPAGGLHIPGQ